MGKVNLKNTTNNINIDIQNRNLISSNFAGKPDNTIR